ncbi:MAG: hypothetical protein M3N28_02075 [Actinomycetota bacterium]|nr:hypothetical protein [Actinomycetota bacterium]
MEPKTGRGASGNDDRHPSVVVEGSVTSPKVSCELPIDGSDGWYVSAIFLEEEGQLVMAELKVFPGPGSRSDGRRGARRKPGDWSGRQDALREVPDGGVSARLLRCIRLTDLQQLVMSELPATSGASGQPTRSARVGRPGSAGRPDRQYAEWAFRYAKKLAEGSRSPIKDLAAEHGRSPGQVRDLIHDARVRGLLSKERQGRAAGSLTPKAIQLLRGDD